MCIECDKLRLIYGKSKLTERQKVQLALLLSSYDFTCGSPLTPPQHSLHGKLVTKMNINCGSPMEIAYYSSSTGRRDICYYCGATEAETNMELKKNLKQSYHYVKLARTWSNNHYLTTPWQRIKKIKTLLAYFCKR